MNTTTNNTVSVSITNDGSILAKGLPEGTNPNDFITEVCDNNEPDAAKYVKAVVKALQLGDDMILLGISWATKESIRNHTRFPHIFGVDVTHGTNNERRPHLRVVGKNMRNNNLPFIDGFLPSEQRYVFSWFFGKAVPRLLCQAALKKTKLIVTDQDIHMIASLESYLKSVRLPVSIYGDGVHRLCKWHKVCILGSMFQNSHV